MNKITNIAIALLVFGGFLVAYPAVTQAYYQSGQVADLSQIPTQYARVNEHFEFTISGSDNYGNPLEYQALSLPSGASFNSSSRIFSWTPQNTGNYTARFRSFDPQGSYSDVDVKIRVDGNFYVPPYNPPAYNPYVPVSGPVTSVVYSNQALPVFDNFNPLTVAREGQLYTYTVQARSQNGDKVTYRLIEAPQGMTINQNLGVILWVPNFSQARTQPYLVTVGISNGYREASRSFYVAVIDVQPTIKEKIIKRIVEVERIPPAGGDVKKDVTVDENLNVATDTEAIDETTCVGDDDLKTADKKSDTVPCFDKLDEDEVSAIAVITGIIFSPWLLLLIILILLAVIYKNYRKKREEEQLAKMRAIYEEKSKEIQPEE